MARALKPLTIETLQEEIRFLLKTLLRDDLFGDEVGVSEAEKLLESSLSIGFVEYCAFLKRHAFLDIDRTKNTITVMPRGKQYAEGNADPSLGPALSSHFASRLGASASPVSSLATTAAPAQAPVFSAHLGIADSLKKTEKQKTSAAMALLERERYTRGEVIGHGSLGVVMVGRDTTLDRDVVVKEVRHVYDLVTYLPREEITNRVKTAVMAQARLDHPHILRVVDVQFSGDAPTIVLDRAHESLAARAARGPLPVDVVLRILLQVCYGLSAAHRAGIIHGGLKPENVLFDAAGNVKLADFGIARVTERGADPSTSAPPVYVGRGHPSYMAPEQLHKGKVHAPGDVYALGILLYEMLTGTLPGRRSPMPSSSEHVVQALGKDKAAALDDLFDRMTRDPLHERFAGIDDVLTALYAAFPSSLVGMRGTLLLSEFDPLPPSPPAAAPAPGEAPATNPEESPGASPVEVTAVTKVPAALQDG